MTTMVAVTVPDGIYEGQEFVLEYDGQQLTVVCPDGCGPGSDIDLEVPCATGDSSASGAAAPNLVDVEVPDGCFPGMEFTVEFEGRAFNITVPDGMSPGEILAVDVPPAEPAESAPLPRSPAAALNLRNLHTSKLICADAPRRSFGSQCSYYFL